MSDTMDADVLAGIKEIEPLGVEVLRVEVVAPGSPPRYFVKFTKPLHEVRMALEAKLYDVGQQNNKDGIGFYVTKRIEKVAGWSQ